jgi:hypothetical protein
VFHDRGSERDLPVPADRHFLFAADAKNRRRMPFHFHSRSRSSRGLPAFNSERFKRIGSWREAQEAHIGLILAPRAEAATVLGTFGSSECRRKFEQQHGIAASNNQGA